MTRIHELTALGQSIWFDYIRRAFLAQGDLQALLDQGVRGVTSNPTIFEKAIAGSSDYDGAMRGLVAEGRSVAEIYEALASDDIRGAADLLRPLYDASNAVDGYVSLEVSPTLAHDTAGTVAEARRLHAALGRPNVMIKVPATPAGLPAITALIADGISVNVTLIFSLTQYEAVAEAYLAGLEARAAAGGELVRIASVASFFVSRVDGLVDPALAAAGADELRGKAAIANAKLAYARFRELFAGPRWAALAAKGAQVQRPLWASTGTKDPRYPDTLYVDSLIGPDTVNTVPPATLTAFLDHGTAAATLDQGLDEARAVIEQLGRHGVDLDAITRRLQDEGVAAFATSFEALMASVADKRARLLAEAQPYYASLGQNAAAHARGLAELRDQDVLRRIWAHDHTVWKSAPTEISNRLGWLHSPERLREQVPQLLQVVEELRAAGYTHALLLGMGGSSLAPELFRATFGVRPGFLDLAVLDSTDPGAVLAHAERLDPRTTLFVVSTKSGGTVETFSFFKFFYNRVAAAVGADAAGQHFVAITDPGSGLEQTARQYRFRHIFLNDPNIGGRYSALSLFGLVPAALVGVDIAALLDDALEMATNAAGCNCPVDGDNAGAWLGALLGELGAAKRDKLTLLVSPPIAAFGAWAEQLIAESTGKDGVGILPVADEPPGPPDRYGADRLFVYLRLADDTTYDATAEALRAAGQPVAQINLRSLHALGGEFFRWELATAIAGRRLGINPFDQPNVEAAKVLARQLVAAYQQEGRLPELRPTLSEGEVTVYTDTPAFSLAGALESFLAQARPGDYLALQAYLQPNAATAAALQALRGRLRERTGLATTLGYGPRFLHSTGQLHKGDGGNGLFIQIVAAAPVDAPIPDEAGAERSSISFEVLKQAQALGDRQALLDAGRRLIRIDLGRDVAGGLARLEALAGGAS